MDGQQVIAEQLERSTEGLARQEMHLNELMTRSAWWIEETLACLKYKEQERVLQLQLEHEAAVATMKADTEKRITDITQAAKDEAEARYVQLWGVRGVWV